jgi:transposase
VTDFENATSRRIRLRRQDVRLLVRQGLSERMIAEKLGVSRSTVWSDKQALGLGG